MVCPHCRTPNPEGTSICLECKTPIDLGDATVVLGASGSGAAPTAGLEGGGTGWSQAATWNPEAPGAAQAIEPGVVLAGRYEILELLGEGGMGAVYRARDRELDRVVALKVIRPEYASNALVLQRFKQELVLARQITHRNIIRIFDLGSAGPTRFITMEYVAGEDLSSVLAHRGKLPAAEAVEIVRQVCRGLEAAHEEGVVHRDLKPQNIMIDRQGKVLVMDFGIARSTTASKITRTGALTGTPTYMSPEQAQGQKVDARSDLYTLGIIFYELLTGRPPFDDENPMATLVRRIQEKPTPPIEVEPAIPVPLNQIILKMLATLPADRYQSAAEILAALDKWENPRAAQTMEATAVAAPARGFGRDLPIRLAAAAILILGAVAGWLYTHHPAGAPASTIKPVRVLVADFHNATGDAVFDGTLEPAVGLALEGASFISAYPRGEAHKAAAQLSGATVLDSQQALLVARREGIDVVVSGEIAQQAKGYRIRLDAVDGASGKPIASRSGDASGKQEVLAEAGKLAAPIRKALGDTTPEAVQMQAAETYGSSSIEAAQSYAKAQQLQWSGNWKDQMAAYQQAIALDPNMGRAYAGLAVAYRNLGHRDEAEQYFKLAISRIDRMTERERYRTRGAYYLFQRNSDLAIKEFSDLLKQFPADDAARTNLALAYFYKRDIARAAAEQKEAIKIYPRNLLYRHNATLYDMYAGQFAAAIADGGELLKLNPKFYQAYLPIALAQLAQGKTAEAEAAYRQMQAMGPDGASLAAMGLADIALYEGRNSDAAAILQNGIAADLAAKNNSAAAIKMAALAGADRKRARAAENAAKALAADNDVGVAFAAARALREAGQEGKALAIAADLAKHLEPEPQAYAKLLEGEAVLEKNPRAAVGLFQDAGKLVDTWLGRLDLAQAYLAAGAFTEASSELDNCRNRSGEATAVFLDDIPSYRYFPPVYYYLGRVQQGNRSPAAAESFRQFLAIKAKADAGDRMVEDARKRAGK
ncbi:MAG TPA: protein kinase [Bryobacteraceae bacterium]|nr:protein kinase [Bryobacteraceae bacterium]